jgi:hypothetical protein
MPVRHQDAAPSIGRQLCVEVFTMPLSTVRWEETIKGVGRGAKARRKFVANRPRNWLLALDFLACAKQVAGKELSDLEAHLVHTLLASKVGEPIIHAMAQAQQATPAALRHEVFPDRFAALDIADTVRFADLAQLAPGIVADVLGQPNVRNLDIAKLHAAPGLVKRCECLRWCWTTTPAP